MEVKMNKRIKKHKLFANRAVVVEFENANEYLVRDCGNNQYLVSPEVSIMDSDIKEEMNTAERIGRQRINGMNYGTI